MEKEDKEIQYKFISKEIDIIQNIINRMSSNSFLIKGWTLSLVIITMIFKGNEYQTLLAIIPLISLWILDAYFLQQERLYRKLYNWIALNRLITDEYLFSTDTKRFNHEVSSIPRIMFSRTFVFFYGSIFFLLIIYIVIFIFLLGGSQNG